MFLKIKDKIIKDLDNIAYISSYFGPYVTKERWNDVTLYYKNGTKDYIRVYDDFYAYDDNGTLWFIGTVMGMPEEMKNKKFRDFR